MFPKKKSLTMTQMKSQLTQIRQLKNNLICLVSLHTFILEEVVVQYYWILSYLSLHSLMPMCYQNAAHFSYLPTDYIPAQATKERNKWKSKDHSLNR